MISPKASQRLDDYQCACSSKNRTEKEFTLRQREPTAEGGKCREREQLTQAHVFPWRFHRGEGDRRVTRFQSKSPGPVASDHGPGGPDFRGGGQPPMHQDLAMMPLGGGGSWPD
jgi:hypothetical protein